jgi:hypothetical protein
MMSQKIFSVLLFVSIVYVDSYAQNFVSQDSVMNPKSLRKHIEVSLLGGIPSVGLGISTYKNKHSWAFTGNVGFRNAASTSIPTNNVLLTSFQTEYRHRIKTQKAPVFWHLDVGLNYALYKQQTTFTIPPVTLEGGKFFPNFGFGTGYFFSISDKSNIEIMATANYQPVDTKIVQEINSVFTGNGILYVSNGFVAFLKLRYGF